MIRVAWILIGIALTLSWGLSAQAAKWQVQDAPAEYQAMEMPEITERDLSWAKRKYKSECADCHGEAGEGTEDDDESVIFTDAEWMSGRSDGQLFYTIKNGGRDETDMEAYGDESDYGYSDHKVWRLVAYIRSFLK